MTTTTTGPLLARWTAFTLDPAGGNPAGVWLGERLPDTATMQRIATEVGYSETAFLAPLGDRAFAVRYYSPEAEVPFCGHATIAAGVLLGDLAGAGTYRFETAAGLVPVEVARSAEGFVASLTSVATEQRPAAPDLLAAALESLGWRFEELDPALPPAVAFAGAWHLVLAVAARATLDRLDYDFARLKQVMLAAELTTLQLVWRERTDRFHSRNPFPVGGVVEDPATGAAAAALGGYLRDAGLERAPFDFTLIQGEAIGRPSRIEVHVPERGGVVVSGTAVPVPGAEGRER